jgi:hypothetical protein
MIAGNERSNLQKEARSGTVAVGQDLTATPSIRPSGMIGEATRFWGKMVITRTALERHTIPCSEKKLTCNDEKSASGLGGASPSVGVLKKAGEDERTLDWA